MKKHMLVGIGDLNPSESLYFETASRWYCCLSSGCTFSIEDLD